MAKKKKIEETVSEGTTLSTLAPSKGSVRERKRIGRGQGSGRGGTSTKGHKGAQSRTGYSRKIGFEGGQMPLYRRLPKFGFKNPFRVEYTVLNLDRLTEALEKHPFLLETGVSPETLFAAGVISTRRKPVKLLGRGELSAALKISVHKCSASALAAVEQAGGTVTLLNTEPTEETQA